MLKQRGCCPWGWGSRLNSCGVVQPLFEITIQSTVFPKETAESATRRLSSPDGQSCRPIKTYACSNQHNTLWQALFVFFPVLEQVKEVSCSRTGCERVACLIWALSGWGSRLYSLVGGIAACSGDNYTVYCLPWGVRWTLINLRHTLTAEHHIYSEIFREKNRWYVLLKVSDALIEAVKLVSQKYVNISIKSCLPQISCPIIRESDLDFVCRHLLHFCWCHGQQQLLGLSV